MLKEILMRLALAAVLCFLLASHTLAQEVSISESDTSRSVLAAQKGKRVTLRLQSGQEITGLVRETNATLVVVGALTGREFFDAIVPIESIEAVIIRTKQ